MIHEMLFRVGKDEARHEISRKCRIVLVLYC